VEAERAWQVVRRIVIERDEGRCRECGIVAPPGEFDVHHRIPRADGGRDEASNCVLLCDGCHARRHPNLQVSLARRTIERWALRLARWLDVRRELPEETRAFQAGLRLFGVDRFREGQLDAVLAALNGESMLVVRPTGSGKSLCFQLPAVLKGQPTTYVLSPTKTLMVDQAMGLHQKQLPATFINGDIRGREKTARYELLEHGALALIYLTPERFGRMVRPEEVARLTRRRPSFLVVDEAHCVDAWGQDFRPDYGRIGELRHRLGDPPVLALTATAGLESQRRILESLGIQDARVLLSDVDRPNIALARFFEPDDARRAQIVGRILGQLDGRALIFVPTEREGRKVQEVMAAAGHDLDFYYGSLDKLDRDRLQNRFSGQHEPGLNVLITTTAFAMGVDIPDIRLVVHWRHSHTVEDYLQEFGRAGRDGRPALALLFTEGARDLGLLEWMARSSSDEAVEKRALSSVAAARNLQRRLERLDLIQSLVADRQHCFRAGLMEVLQGPKRRVRRSFSRWLLDLVFTRRVKTTPAGVCCDHCNPELAQAAVSGRLVLDGRPLGGGTSPAQRVRLLARRAARHQRRQRAAPEPPLSISVTRTHRGMDMPDVSLRGVVRIVKVLATLVVLAIVASFVFGLVKGGIDAVKHFQHEGQITKAADTFDRYVSNRELGDFIEPRVRSQGDDFIACAHRPHDQGNGFCLVIRPDQDSGHRVTGSYRRRGNQHVDCTGSAVRLGLCRRR
jgi:ATP-dependent DNA helicase RecQ